jgi:murein DD-endopeptidase MepM/ murein hydrolase activator NlpD
LQPQSGYAQDDVGRYTVVAGDSLSAIAARFDVPVDALIQLNNIADPSLIRVGQEILIPTDGQALALGVVETVDRFATPDETLAGFAARTGQEAELLAALNGITLSARLWPGQPIVIPADQATAPPLRFGALTGVDVTPAIAQGRTGRLQITFDRPISLRADWNGLPLPLVTLPGPTYGVEALLPAPALIEPGTYSVTMAYTTARGIPLTLTRGVEIIDGGYSFQNIFVPPEKSETLDPTTAITETELIRAVFAPASPHLTARAAFVRPLGTEYATTSPFGTRRSYNDGVLSSYHAGQDFGAGVGVTVTAPLTGVVVLAQPLPIRGNAVVLDHGSGVYSGYWHLSEMTVQSGQEVGPGAVIGLVGNTGRSTGAHLHWEMRIHGVAVDPMQFLDEEIYSAGASP